MANREFSSKISFHPENDRVASVRIRASDKFLGSVAKLNGGRWHALSENLDDLGHHTTRAQAGNALLLFWQRNVDRMPIELHGFSQLPLLQLGEYTLASGIPSWYKIECDALTDKDWQAIAALISVMVPAFGRVEGVPRGGLTLAKNLEPYCNPNSTTLLLCDDVWTTGLSMKRYYDQMKEKPFRICGAVAFSRGYTPSWLYPLFSIHPNVEAYLSLKSS